MKKRIIILIIILLIIGILFGTYWFIKKHQNKSTTYFHTIGYKEVKEKLDNKDTFILVIHQTGCSHCANYLPTVESISNEYKLDVYNINITNLSEEDSNSFNGLIHYPGTPTTIFIFNGEEKTPLNRINGETSKTTTIERYKSLGFISDNND